MTLRTLHNRVIVKRDKPAEKIGMIFIPDIAKELQNQGTVLAVKDGLDVKVDDRVLFVKACGTTVAEGKEEEILILYEYEIYGVIVDECTHCGELLSNGPFVESSDPHVFRQVLRPIGSKVVIKPDPPEEKIGRIELPKWVAKEKHERESLVSGQIVAMGPGMRTKNGTRWPMVDVKVGQRVLYFHSFTPKFEIGGEMIVVVAEDQLRASFEE
jgi:chaperonin GroES